MDFTREPIIETVITPREGSKLVLRNSKNGSQEEYFVDAVEVVSFGSSFFFRSMERPKSFLVPVTDYEILEVRETRMVLKNVAIDRAAIKIGGGRDAGRATPREDKEPAAPEEPKMEKKRDRRRHARRRRGREDKEETKVAEEKTDAPPRRSPQLKGRTPQPEETVSEAPVTDSENGELSLEEQLGFSSPMFSTLLPPPPKLISETISKYRTNEEYKDAFFEAGEEEGVTDAGAEKEAPVAEDVPPPTPPPKKRRGRPRKTEVAAEAAPAPVEESVAVEPEVSEPAQAEEKKAEPAKDDPAESEPPKAEAVAEAPADPEVAEEVTNGNQAPA